MIISIIIFLIAIIAAFGMLFYRAWEIRTSRIAVKEERENYLPKLSLKEVEKIALHVIKHVIQSIVIFTVKGWFLFITKTKILIQNKSPKIHKFFQKKTNIDSRKISFVERAIIESKIKIKKVKEKIKKEHEEIEENNEVDKIL
jgi:H+/gluconate symporter-like permease